MSAPIYLDYAATTPLDPAVRDAMTSQLGTEHGFGNPASITHAFGWQAAKAVELAREQVAALVNASPEEIIWTSGATESDNLAIKGIAEFYHRKGKHIITLKTEHKAVLDTCADLERRGYEVTYLTPNTQGLVKIEDLKAALRPDTILVSVMHVNNETGVIQDLHAVANVLQDKGIFLHVDAAQSAGKIPIDLATLPVDLMSFSAHKVYGPKGMGALYVRRRPRVRLTPQIHGGGHERGLRSGTLAPHQIVGMGKAFDIARQQLNEESKRLQAMKQNFWQRLQTIPEIFLNGSLAQGVPGILNVSFNHVEGEALLMALHELAVSTGSACTSANIEPSHVLSALGQSDELAHSAIRFSFGRFTTEQELKRAANIVIAAVAKLRSISPLWQANTHAA